MMNTWPGWESVEEIGKGSFGSVYKIQKEEYGHVYKAALKVISIPTTKSEVSSLKDMGMSDEKITTYYQNTIQTLSNEFALMAELKGNSNIVSYEDHKVIPKQDSFGWDILIRMELLTPLRKYIEVHPLSKADVVKMGIGLCNALEICQKKGILHRDIKPGNIFVNENGDFKLGDFGVSKTLEDTKDATTKVGTYHYMAPEVFNGKNYGHTADLYSLAMVMYQYLNNNALPFIDEGADRMLTRRMSGEKIPAPSNGDEALDSIILKCLECDPSQRFQSALDVKRALEEYQSGSYVHKVEEAPTVIEEYAYCPHCGTRQRVDAEFCGACGKPMKNHPASTVEPAPKKKLNVAVIVVCVAALIVVGMLGYLIVSSNTGEDESEETNSQEVVEITCQSDEEWNESAQACVTKEVQIDRSHDYIYLPDDGETVYFGVYEQDGDESNGPEPIEWITLNIGSGVHAGQALLVSKYVLDVVDYSESDVAWEDSNLRSWLNGDFYNTAFDESEQSRILYGENQNESLSVTTSAGYYMTTINGNPTSEYITILRPGENALDYYVSAGLMEKQAYGTAYAWMKYANLDSADSSSHTMGYALRGMGYTGPYVNDEGKYSGSNTDVQRFGVRPCLFVQG